MSCVRLRVPCESVALLAAAAAIGGCWVAMNHVGWREHTSFLSAGITDGDPESALIKAVLYAGIRLLFVLVAPVLALSAIVLVLIERALAPANDPSDPKTEDGSGDERESQASGRLTG
jgi:hypothetical protein